MSWIYTYTGKKFSIENPVVDDVSIEDIAHSLAYQPRFCGHTPYFYSVAQHCLVLCDIVADEFKIWALLHDAAEAYLSDVPAPVKDMLSEYKAMEINILKVVADKYAMHWYKPRGIPQIVVEADRRLLGTEALIFYGREVAEKFRYKSLGFYKDLTITFICPEKIERLFLDRAKGFGLY